MTRKAHHTGLAAIALAVAAAGCNNNVDPDVIEASGHVEATEVRVSAEVGGRLEELAVDEGDSVAKDQLLARLDTADTELALDASRAELRQAQADLALRLAGARAEEIAEAKAQVAEAEAALAGAELDLQRMQGLLDSGSGTPKARDEAKTRRDRAQATLAAARERLARLEAGSRAEEIEAARARVAGAEARIAQLEKQLKDAEVKSPLDGVVTERLSEAGELLTRGTALVTITRLGDAWLNVYVAEPDLGRIRLGQEAEVITDGGETRTGRVTFVASRAEFTPKNVQTRDERVKLVYRVKVGLPNQDGLFKPGMPATARLNAKSEAAS
jgi:HlyD family secretion protein